MTKEEIILIYDKRKWVIKDASLRQPFLKKEQEKLDKC